MSLFCGKLASVYRLTEDLQNSLGVVYLDRVVSVDTLPSLGTQKKIALKYHLREAAHTSHLQDFYLYPKMAVQVPMLPDQDTYKKIRDAFKANSREFDFARKVLKGYASDPFSKPFSSY